METKKDVVEVATTQAGYKFPVGHPTRKADSGKEYYQVPVEYRLFEWNDFGEFAEKEFDAIAASVGGEDELLKAMNAGIRLAQGDKAKAAFRVSQGKDTLIEAMAWLGQNARIAEWQEVLLKDGQAKANAWVIEEYNNRK